MGNNLRKTIWQTGSEVNSSHHKSFAFHVMMLAGLYIPLWATKWPQDIGRMCKKLNKVKSRKETWMNFTLEWNWPCLMIKWQRLLGVLKLKDLRYSDIGPMLDINQCWRRASSNLTITFSLSFSGLISLICIATLKWYFGAPALTDQASCHLECLCLSIMFPVSILLVKAGVELWYTEEGLLPCAHDSDALSRFSSRCLSGSVLPCAAASSGHPEDHPGQRHHRGHRHFPAVPGQTQTGWEWNDVCLGQQQHLLDGGDVL